jgi:hypothetical protein
MNNTEQIRSFVTRALKVSGAPFQEVEKLLITQVTVEHPPFIFGPPRLETVSLNLVFHPEDVAKYPGAELIIPGSFRLNWIIDGLRQRGLIFLGSIHYDDNLRRWQREIQSLIPPDFPYFFFHRPQLRYRPFMLNNFLVSYQADEREDELVSIGIDLCNGMFRPDLNQLLSSQKISSKTPSSGLMNENVPIFDAISLCKSYIEDRAQQKEATWIKDAHSRFSAELSCLQQYYKENDDTEGFNQRSLEIFEKFRPRIIISWLNLAIIYLPEVVYSLQSLDGKDLPSAIYSPVESRLEFEE